MITREDVEKVYSNRKKTEVKEEKASVELLLSRISEFLSRGKLSIPNVGRNPRVHAAVAKALAKEDINIEFFSTEFKARRKKSLTDCKVMSARLSLKED